jgi:hypothetical protein
VVPAGTLAGDDLLESAHEVLGTGFPQASADPVPGAGAILLVSAQDVED